jgi:hypothetical protein
MSQEISNYPPVIPSYYYEMGYQIPPFFVALTPDMNGHCDIDDSYYAYYEATLDDYYSCLGGAKKTPPITKENVKCNVMSNVKILLTFVNRTLQRLRVGNEDNHLPTYNRIEAQTICSMERTGREEGYMMRVAVSFPCPLEEEKLDESSDALEERRERDGVVVGEAIEVDV